MTCDARRARCFVVIVLCAGLAGCQEGAEVDVDQAGQDVIFNVRLTTSSSKPCVESLDVLPADSNGANPMWEVSRDDATRVCGQRFIFGRGRTGYTETARPSALIKGKRYRVEARGPGYRAVHFFVVGDRDGAIGRDPHYAPEPRN